jgi:predicted deacylase
LPIWLGPERPPTDGKNLARVFPGRADGTVTDRIAYVLFNSVISKAEYLIDLHSGGSKYTMAPHVQYRCGLKASKESLELAEVFGTDIIYKIAALPGRITSVAVGLGIPSVEPEMRGEGQCLDEYVQIDVRGIKNVMRHLGMVEGKPERPTVRKYIEASVSPSGEIDARKAGLVIPHIGVGLEVCKRQKLVTLIDPYGNEVDSVCAPHDGIVFGLRTFPTVLPGDPLLFIGKEVSRDKL